MANRRFASFIVVRATSKNTEIHTVGASGAALDELLDAVEGAITSAFETGDLVADDVAEITWDRIGQHPDAPTGIRINGFTAPAAVRNVLDGMLEDVLVAE